MNTDAPAIRPGQTVNAVLTKFTGAAEKTIAARHVKQASCTVSAIAFLLPATELSMTTQATINASSAAATSLTTPIAEAAQMAGGPIVSAVTQGRA